MHRLDEDQQCAALSKVAEGRRALRAVENLPRTLAWQGATERLLRLEVQLAFIA